jgi:hypothetical protein
MITRAIEKCFNTARKRKWDKTYWAIDIHETIIHPNYDEPGIPTQWYPFAKEAMQMLSKRKDVELILYTCSWKNEIQEYLNMFEKDGIHFNYINANPDVKNTDYGCYEFKPYFNILFEDKAGFHPDEWSYVIELLNYYPDGYGLMSDEEVELYRKSIGM